MDKKFIRKKPSDRIEGNKIFLDAWGNFPKEIVITDGKETLGYRLIRTKNGRIVLNR